MHLSFKHARPLRLRWRWLLPLLLAGRPAWGGEAALVPATADSPAFPSHLPPQELRDATDSRPKFGNSGDFIVSANEVASASAKSPLSASDKSASTPAKPSAGAGANAAPPAPSTPSAMAELVSLLVSKNVINADAGDRLIKQSAQELDQARAQAAATQAAADRALTAATSQPAAPPAARLKPDDEEEVAYVPPVVKQQITDEVTQNVLKQTSEERAAPDNTPAWVKKFNVTGDLRVRAQQDIFPAGNAVGNFTNFNSINTTTGFNVNAGTPSLPQYDVNQDRTLFRLRARIGSAINVGDGFTAGLRIATGSDDSPVSENQTLGAANSAQGGNFGKYQIWLDRAFIKYEMWGQPDRDLAFAVGRFDNPFYHTSMLFSDDVAFDGIVAQGKFKAADGVTPFLTAGAFPVFNTDLNFSTNQASKYQSEDKYLFAAQGGTTWQLSKDFSVKGAVAYYDFENVQGKVSDPITLASTNESGNTDDSRPSFAQNGNTYIALRDYEDPAPGTTQEIQYYGLATPFHEVVLTGQVDYSGFDPFHLWLMGEVVKNVAFDRNSIVNGGPTSDPGPQNNTTGTAAGSFNGGDTGYDVSLHMGKVLLQQPWDWNVSAGYRYVESDATIDGFTDTNFGGTLAGTNLQGFILEGNLALTPHVFTSLRWMSAQAIAGPTYKSDLFQFDLNATF